MKFIRISSALGLSVFAAVIACSSTTTTPPTTTTDAAAEPDAETTDDAGTSTDATTTKDSSPTTCTPAADAGASCNEVANGATVIKIVAKAMAIPTGVGGPIADGRYFLTDVSTYTGSLLTAGVDFKHTLELCAGVGQLSGEDNGKPAYRKSFTYAPTGTQPNIVQGCSTQSPNVDVPYTSYTATPTTVTFFSTQYVFSATYTKS